MVNFSMFIKGKNESSEIVDEIVELLPKATYVSMFSKDAEELNAELIDMVVSFGFVTDGVIGVAKFKEGESHNDDGTEKTASSFVNFKRPAVTANALAQARARMVARKRG
jgi:hypothetical protein